MSYAATAGWPLRRVVSKRATIKAPGHPPDYIEMLECGHEVWPPGWTYKPAKRRRCEQCSIDIGNGIVPPLAMRRDANGGET